MRVKEGYDGVWSHLATTHPNTRAVEESLLDPANRELLKDTKALKEIAERVGKTTHAPELSFYERLLAIGQNIGDRNGALVFADTDFSSYLDLSDKEKEILVPVSASVAKADDDAAALAYNTPSSIGVLHALADSGAEAHVIGWNQNTLGSRLYEIFHAAEDDLMGDMVYCNELAEPCLAAVDNIEEDGFAVASLIHYRDFERELKAVVGISSAENVALTGSNANPYEAYSKRFQDLLAQNGFVTKGAKSPENDSLRRGLAIIDVDELIPSLGNDDVKFRTRMGVVAYLLATGNYEVERDWFNKYRPIVMESLTEEQAEHAFNDFLHIQHEGFHEKAKQQPGEGKGRVNEEYQARMRKLCGLWLPDVMAATSKT